MVPLSLFTVFLPNWDWDHDPLPHLICLSHSLSITPSFCFSCALARLFCAEAINSFALLWMSSSYCTSDCFDVHRLTFHLSLVKPSSLLVLKQTILNAFRKVLHANQSCYIKLSHLSFCLQHRVCGTPWDILEVVSKQILLPWNSVMFQLSSYPKLASKFDFRWNRDSTKSHP